MKNRHGSSSDGNGRAPREKRRVRGSRRRRTARMTISVLPTMFTLGNLLCGFAAIFVASRAATLPGETPAILPWDWSPLTFAAMLIFLGMVFDGLDGRIARLTHNTSDLGEQLDSMADMVTFGVAPAFLAVQLAGVGLPFFSERGDQLFDRFALVVAGIYVACAGLRLARFNLEIEDASTESHMSFKGLPSPGAAGTVASLVLLHQHFLGRHEPEHWSIWASSIVMVDITGLTAFAMVSRLRYVHVVNRYLRGRAKFSTISKIVIVVALLLVHVQGALAAAFAAYAISAPAIWVWRKLLPGSAGGEPIIIDGDDDVSVGFEEATAQNPRASVEP